MTTRCALATVDSRFARANCFLRFKILITPAAWREEFLGCDYIGAQWFWHDDAMRVGNGGFSLRSRKLLLALQDLDHSRRLARRIPRLRLHRRAMVLA